MIHLFCRNSACGYTLVTVYLRLLEIHLFCRNSACGNTLVIVYLRLLEIHLFWRNSTCGDTPVLVNFRNVKFIYDIHVSEVRTVKMEGSIRYY